MIPYRISMNLAYLSVHIQGVLVRYYCLYSAVHSGYFEYKNFSEGFWEADKLQEDYIVSILGNNVMKTAMTYDFEKNHPHAKKELIIYSHWFYLIP
jgi:hypothetical protein